MDQKKSPPALITQTPHSKTQKIQRVKFPLSVSPLESPSHVGYILCANHSVPHFCKSADSPERRAPTSLRLFYNLRLWDVFNCGMVAADLLVIAGC
jgi:hypothetical protein